MSKVKSILGELPANVIPDAIALMDSINGTHFPICPETLAEEVYSVLAKRHPGSALNEELRRLNLDTTEGMRQAVDAYTALRKTYPKMSFCGKSEMGSTEVTDTALFIIDSVVRKRHVTDRFDIVSAVCDVMEKKFGESERLERNLDKFNLRTTKDILHAIDIYFVMRKLYPDTVYGRERMVQTWADVI